MCALVTGVQTCALPIAWPLAGVAVAAAALLDLLRLRRRATPEVVREMPEALPIGIEREVTLHIESGPRRQCVDVFDLHPGGWESTGLTRSLRLPPDPVSSFGYRLRPPRSEERRVGEECGSTGRTRGSR